MTRRGFPRSTRSRNGVVQLVLQARQSRHSEPLPLRIPAFLIELEPRHVADGFDDMNELELNANLTRDDAAASTSARTRAPRLGQSHICPANPAAAVALALSAQAP